MSDQAKPSRLTFVETPSHPHRSLQIRKSQGVRSTTLATSVSRLSIFPHETKTGHGLDHKPSQMMSRPQSFHYHQRDQSKQSSSPLTGSRGQTSETHPGLLDNLEDPNHPLYHHGHHHGRHTEMDLNNSHHHHHHGHHHHHHNASAPVLEEIHATPTDMTRETLNSYREARRRIKELQETNFKNDQIILFFVASRDRKGRVWHNDCNMADREVNFIIKKIKAGGHFLKINVGERSEWLDPSNHWKKDPKYKITTLPTLMVCNTMKRLNGKKVFDMEAVVSLLQD